MVISFSSTWKGLCLFHERVWTNTTDPRSLSDSSVGSPLVIVIGMWWRALGVAAVLLCVGVAGGYAVADRDEEEPATSTVLEPVPGVSPAVPTPPVPTYSPDATDPPLRVSELTFEPVPLRLDPGGAGVRVDVPVGWRSARPENTNQWNFVDPEHSGGTYLLRVTIVRGANVSPAAAVLGRIAALNDAAANGDIDDFEVTVQTDDTFEGTYVVDGRLRLTTERWVAFDGTNAYASVALTGREVDRAGMGDLLGRTITSMRELPPKSPDQTEQSPKVTGS